MPYDTDDFHLEYNFFAGLNRDMPAKRVLAVKVQPLHVLVDYCDGLGFLVVLTAEVSASEKGHPHRISVTGACDIEHGIWKIAQRRPGLPVYKKGNLVVVSVQRHQHRGGRGADARHLTEIAHEIPEKSPYP